MHVKLDFYTNQSDGVFIPCHHPGNKKQRETEIAGCINFILGDRHVVCHRPNLHEDRRTYTFAHVQCSRETYAESIDPFLFGDVGQEIDEALVGKTLVLRPSRS
jgi:hypothetical protein